MYAAIHFADRWLFRGLAILACLALATLVAVCLFQVFARFVLAIPTVWTEALARTLMIWSVFLGMPVALRRGQAITMSVAAEMAPPRVKAILRILVFISVMLVLAIALWQGLALLHRIANQRLAGLDIPIVWAYAAIPVGAALGLIALIFNKLEQLQAGPVSEPAFVGDTI